MNLVKDTVTNMNTKKENKALQNVFDNYITYKDSVNTFVEPLEMVKKVQKVLSILKPVLKKYNVDMTNPIDKNLSSKIFKDKTLNKKLSDNELGKNAFKLFTLVLRALGYSWVLDLYSEPILSKFISNYDPITKNKIITNKIKQVRQLPYASVEKVISAYKYYSNLAEDKKPVEVVKPSNFITWSDIYNKSKKYPKIVNKKLNRILKYKVLGIKKHVLTKKQLLTFFIDTLGLRNDELMDTTIDMKEIIMELKEVTHSKYNKFINYSRISNMESMMCIRLLDNWQPLEEFNKLSFSLNKSGKVVCTNKDSKKSFDSF